MNNNRNIRIQVLFIMVLLTVSCGGGATELETATANSEPIFGKLEKEKDYDEGDAFEELIVVRNCNNPLARSDTLIEARAIERADAVSIVGTVGVEVGMQLAASASASIAAGYEQEISEALSRGREQMLPVGANSSMGYVIEWKPRVWSGILPFENQSGEGQITYNYTDVEFGAVKTIIDMTEEHCGQTDSDDEPAEDGQSESVPETEAQEEVPPTNTPEPTSTPAPTDTAVPTSTPIPVDTATPIPTSTPLPAPVNTDPGSVLAVGETWIQDGVGLTLESVDRRSKWMHTFWMVVENNTGQDIVLNPSEAATEILNQNYGYEVKRHSYQPPYPPDQLSPGESKRFNLFFNTTWEFDLFSSEIDYYYLRIANFSRIDDALWRVEVPH